MPYKNPEDAKEYGKKYGKQWRSDNPNYQKEWHKKHPKYQIGRLKKFKKKNPTYFFEYNLKNGRKIYERTKTTGQSQATSKVREAINKLRLINLKKIFIKCFYCPYRATCYDHRDYNKPLDVKPVCHSCNIKLGKGIPKKNA